MLASPLAEDRIKAEALVLAALAGDREALALAEEFAAKLADAVDVLAWTVAPELIVLGDGLEAGAELLIPLVQARLRETGALETELESSSIGTDAPLVGAVRYALDRIDSELYGPVLV
jgi:predicted NBD/HSP70 family sugar kinase